MSQLVLLSFLALLGWSPTGHTSCLPEYQALNVEEMVDPATPSAPFSHYLLAKNGRGEFLSRVQLVGRVSAEDVPRLRLSVRFDPDFEGVSLPYNLFVVSVLQGGVEIARLDFTDACSGPGIGFFPGREVELPEIKLVGESPQTLQIMVWGRL